MLFLDSYFYHCNFKLKFCTWQCSAYFRNTFTTTSTLCIYDANVMCLLIMILGIKKSFFNELREWLQLPKTTSLPAIFQRTTYIHGSADDKLHFSKKTYFSENLFYLQFYVRFYVVRPKSELIFKNNWFNWNKFWRAWV